MEEEKMFVLKMLEEGKITAEEAAILLEALEGGGDTPSKGRTRTDLLDKFKEKIKKLDTLSEKVDILSDIPIEVEEGLEEIEERIDKIERRDLGTSIVDKVLNFIWEGKEEEFEKEFEFKSVGESISVKLDIANGLVMVKRWDKDCIYVNTKYTTKNRRREGLDVKYDGDYLKIEGKKGIRRSDVEIYLPYVKCEHSCNELFGL